MVSWLDTLANVGFVFGQGLAFAFIFCMVERGSFLSKRARTCSGIRIRKTFVVSLHAFLTKIHVLKRPCSDFDQAML